VTRSHSGQFTYWAPSKAGRGSAKRCATGAASELRVRRRRTNGGKYSRSAVVGALDRARDALPTTTGDVQRRPQHWSCSSMAAAENEDLRRSLPGWANTQLSSWSAAAVEFRVGTTLEAVEATRSRALPMATEIRRAPSVWTTGSPLVGEPLLCEVRLRSTIRSRSRLTRLPRRRPANVLRFGGLAARVPKTRPDAGPGPRPFHLQHAAAARPPAGPKKKETCAASPKALPLPDAGASRGLWGPGARALPRWKGREGRTHTRPSRLVRATPGAAVPSAQGRSAGPSTRKGSRSILDATGSRRRADPGRTSPDSGVRAGAGRQTGRLPRRDSVAIGRARLACRSTALQRRANTGVSMRGAPAVAGVRIPPSRGGISGGSSAPQSTEHPVTGASSPGHRPGTV